MTFVSATAFAGSVGWSGGFDVVLGNPPWERIKLQEKEWFASRRPDVAKAPNAAARRKMIAVLETEDPALFQAFKDDLRGAGGESHLIRNSGRYPLCGTGDINTYAVFAETNRKLLGPEDRYQSTCGSPSFGNWQSRRPTTVYWRRNWPPASRA